MYSLLQIKNFQDLITNTTSFSAKLNIAEMYPSITKFVGNKRMLTTLNRKHSI